MNKTRLSVALATLLAFHATANAKSPLAISGTIEVQASSTEENSDIAVATAEVGLAAQVNDKVTAELVLLNEVEETRVSVDAATVSLAFSDHLGLTVGQTTIPFGVFGSYMITDPLSLELAETKASVLQADIRTGPLTTSFYGFNGTNAAPQIDNWGVTVAFASQHLLFAMGYLANIGDSDTIAAERIDSKVPGLSFSAGINAGRWRLIGEFITATQPFQAGDGPFLASAQPRASNLELAYAVGATTLAVGMQYTDEAVALELPQKRSMASVTHKLMKNTHVAFELATHEEVDGKHNNTITAQLGVVF